VQDNKQTQPTLNRRLICGVDMICIANGCAKRTCATRLLAQGLRKLSDFLICTQGKL
jgi:hypothetical protein